MKMKFPIVILFAITGLHCGKSKLTENPLPGEPLSKVNAPEITGKVQLLTREVSFTSGNPNLKRIREFSYDEQNRCTKVLLGSIDSSKQVPVFNVTRTITLFYNEGSSLPYKLASVRSVFPHLVTDFYCKYDEKGVKILDSVRVLNQSNVPGDRIVRYEYQKGLILTSPEFTNFPIFFNSFDSLFTDNANIVRKVTRMPTPTGDQIFTLDCEYDNNINPYAAINIYNSLYFANPGTGIGYNVSSETHYLGFNRNNMSAFTAQGLFRTVVNYEYDKFKYPVKSVAFQESSPSFKTTTYFTYKDKE